MSERKDKELSPRLDRTVGRSVFGLDAAGYDAHRLGYPPALFDCIFAQAGPAHELSIFEAGPGTGLATRDIVARRPRRLRAIEPDAALADYLAATFNGNLEIERAPFEESTAETGAFDLGVAAACFHWMDAQAALRQVRRLLRPDGCWAVCWNVYRAAGVGDAFADAVTPLLEGLPLPPSEAAGGHKSLDTDYQQELLRLAGFTDLRFTLFRRERTLDAGSMRDLYASYSFIRALPSETRERLLDRVAELVDRNFGGAAPNVVLTPLYLGWRS